MSLILARLIYHTYIPTKFKLIRLVSPSVEISEPFKMRCVSRNSWFVLVKSCGSDHTVFPIDKTMVVVVERSTIEGVYHGEARRVHGWMTDSGVEQFQRVTTSHHDGFILQLGRCEPSKCHRPPPNTPSTLLTVFTTATSPSRERHHWHW